MISFMKRLFSLVALSIMIGCMVVSCNDVKKTNERIATAETAIAEQDFQAGKRICDEILGDESDESLSATDYARLSILYMQFYENTDDSNALDRAVSCYHHGMEINPDSVKYIYASLPAEDHKYAFALSMIVEGMENTTDESHDNDPYVSPDSVGIVTEEAE